MKHLISGLMMPVTIAIGLAVLSVPTSAEAQTRELRFAEFGPNAGARAGGLVWLDEEMRKRSNGELGLDIIWGGALVGAAVSMLCVLLFLGGWLPPVEAWSQIPLKEGPEGERPASGTTASRHCELETPPGTKPAKSGDTSHGQMISTSGHSATASRPSQAFFQAFL